MTKILNFWTSHGHPLHLEGKIRILNLIGMTRLQNCRMDVLRVPQPLHFLHRRQLFACFSLRGDDNKRWATSRRSDRQFFFHFVPIRRCSYRYQRCWWSECMYFTRVGVDWLVTKQEIKGERLHNWLSHTLISSHHHIITTIMDSAARTLIALKKKKCTPSVKSIRRTTGGKKLDFCKICTGCSFCSFLTMFILFLCFIEQQDQLMAAIILFYFLNKMSIQFKVLFLQDDNPILIFCLFHCFVLIWFWMWHLSY